MKDSLSFHRVAAFSVFLSFFFCLKDGVEGVLTVAPGGESPPRHLDNARGSNNVSRLDGMDGSHHPVASDDIPSLSRVPRGGLQRRGGAWEVAPFEGLSGFAGAAWRDGSSSFLPAEEDDSELTFRRR